MTSHRYRSSRKLTGVVTLVLAVAAPLLAVPSLTVQSYDTVTSFSDTPVVLIHQGDDPAYASIGLDDEQWTVTSLPSAWSDLFPDYNGVAWYRIHIRFPDEIPPYGIGIRLGVITDADETYFNGKLIGSSGRVDEPVKSAYDKKRLYEIPAYLIRPGEDNVLAVRVRGLFPYANGPFTGSFRIGPLGEMEQEFLSAEYVSLIPVVAYLIVALYFFLFFARRPGDKANLLFALFALSMGIYFALRTQAKYFIGVDFFAAKKLEYLVLSTLVVLLTEFLTFYLKKRHTLAHYIFLGLSGAHFLVFLVTGSYIFWDTYNQYVQLPSWALGVTLSFIMLIGSYRTDRDARLMLYALVVLLLTMVNDVLVNMVVYDFPRLSSYGFTFFVAAIAAILSNRFVRLHGEVEDLNRNLELRVKQRTDELNRTVADLEAAKRETDNLLHNVQEGIFLLDPDYVIGEHHSTMLESIFEVPELGGRSFVELIREVVDPETADQTREFIDIALTKRLPDRRLGMLNPIDEIRAVVMRDAEATEKYLRVNFTRIGEKGAYSHLLGTVQDITDAKNLERKVQRSEERAEQEMKLLLGILHLNPEVVRRFVDEARTEMADLEKTLQDAGFSEDLKGLLDSVFRSVHSIKGNASVLGLDLFARQAHEFEEKIRQLFDKEDLSALDMLGLLYAIVGLKDALSQVEELLGRISSFRTEFGGEPDTMSERDLLVQTARDLVARVAEREEKEVDVEFGAFNLPADGSIDSRAVKKVLIQLVKNATTHGIERPEEREAAGKTRRGTITVNATTTADEAELTVKDDGAGIQIEAIRRRAAEAGIRTLEETANWSPQRVAQLVLMSGLSTQADPSLDAGRGVGLDVVRHEVVQAGGKIFLSFTPGEQTRFVIRLPRRPA